MKLRHESGFIRLIEVNCCIGSSIEVWIEFEFKDIELMYNSFMIGIRWQCCPF